MKLGNDSVPLTGTSRHPSGRPIPIHRLQGLAAVNAKTIAVGNEDCQHPRNNTLITDGIAFLLTVASQMSPEMPPRRVENVRVSLTPSRSATRSERWIRAFKSALPAHRNTKQNCCRNPKTHFLQAEQAAGVLLFPVNLFLDALGITEVYSGFPKTEIPEGSPNWSLCGFCG